MARIGTPSGDTGSGMIPEDHSGLQLFAHPAPADSASSGRGSPTSRDGEFTHLTRLYVAGVPKTWTEAQLQQLFDQYGKVQDLVIIYDKITGQSCGYGFVSYATREEADRAIVILGQQHVVLEGAESALKVRLAKNCRGIPPTPGCADNTRLHFSRAPASASQEAIHQLFSAYGQVVGVELFQEKGGVTGALTCGFIDFADHLGAAAAKADLDGKVVNGATAPLRVQWCDPQMQSKKRQAQRALEACSLYYTQLPQNVSKADVAAVFSTYGTVVDVLSFGPSTAAHGRETCGMVQMGSEREAAQAMQSLNDVYLFPGATRAVKVMPAAMCDKSKILKSNKDKSSPEDGKGGGRSSSAGGAALAMNPAGAAGGLPGAPMHMAGTATGQAQPSLAYLDGKDGSTHQLQQLLALNNLQQALGAGLLAGQQLLMSGGMPDSGGSLWSEPPPAGCDQDTFKLFVGNVPKSWTEQHLLPVFEPFGKVAELVITRDKHTRLSKGSAFVWYTTAAASAAAAASLNNAVLCQLSRDGPVRLVVRKAHPRTWNAVASKSAAMQSSLLASMLAQQGIGAVDPNALPMAAALLQQQQQQRMPLGATPPHLGLATAASIDGLRGFDRPLDGGLMPQVISASLSCDGGMWQGCTPTQAAPMPPGLSDGVVTVHQPLQSLSGQLGSGNLLSQGLAAVSLSDPWDTDMSTKQMFGAVGGAPPMPSSMGFGSHPTGMHPMQLAGGTPLARSLMWQMPGLGASQASPLGAGVDPSGMLPAGAGAQLPAATTADIAAVLRSLDTSAAKYFCQPLSSDGVATIRVSGRGGVLKSGTDVPIPDGCTVLVAQPQELKACADLPPALPTAAWGAEVAAPVAGLKG